MNLDDLAKLIPAAAWRLSENDSDPQETREWLDALDALIATGGPQRATYLLKRVLQHARTRRVPLAGRGQHAVPQHDLARRAAAVSRQPRHREPAHGDRALERAGDGGARQPASRPSSAGTSRAMPRRPNSSRWASTTSSAPPSRADATAARCAAPAISSTSSRTRRRACMRAPFSKAACRPSSSTTTAARPGRTLRAPECGKGLCSYPHPWLMPTFWQFPTGSMGLGPLFAIYQARFMRYLRQPRARRRESARRATARSGRSSATARWTSPNRSPRLSLAARERPRQPRVRRQLQPAAARRPGARQRLDRAGARRPVRGRGLERDQAAVEQRLGSAVRARHAPAALRSASSRPSTASSRRYAGHRRRASTASTSSTSSRSCSSSSRTCPTRTSTGCAAAATTRSRSSRRMARGARSTAASRR